MEATLNPDWLIDFLLIATRMAGVFLLLPVLGFTVIPARVRLLFVLTISLIFAGSLGAAHAHAATILELVRLGVIELARGALLAFSVQAAFATLNFAGQLLDHQIGFNAAALFDFNTQAQDPLLSTLLLMLGGLIFVAFDAHLELLRGLAETFRQQPVGAALPEVRPDQLAMQFGGVFVYGFMVASPVVAGLFLFDAATAFISRSMPQLNIYFVSLPIKIFWGLLLLASSLIHVGPLLRAIFQHGALKSAAAS